jgi:hypothetical protein
LLARFQKTDQKVTVEAQMKSVGFNFQKGRIRLVILQRQNDQISFVSKKVIDIDFNLDLPELSERYVTHFRGMLDEVGCDIVAVRHVYDADSVDASISQIMPIGLLALVCQEMGRGLRRYTPQGLRHGKTFKLDKTIKPIAEVDTIFGQHPPHWDDMQRNALLVAWRSLLESPQ